MKYNNIVKRANTRAIDENIKHDESCFKLNFDIEIEKEDYQIMYKKPVSVLVPFMTSINAKNFLIF